MVEQRYYLVKEDAMPTAYLKVLEAKRLLSTGVAQNATAAVRQTPKIEIRAISGSTSPVNKTYSEV